MAELNTDSSIDSNIDHNIDHNADDFETLIAAIESCNSGIYQHDDEQHDDEELWQLPVDLISQRALLLQKLLVITPTVTPQQIEIIGQLYESMLAADEQTLSLAESERVVTRNSLRAIKNAEKSLPAYNALDQEFYR